MADTTPGTVLRQLQQAQGGMKKSRQALSQLRGSDPSPEAVDRVLRLGWESLAAAHRTMAAIPLAAASDEVLTRQIALQRYATALLVRLRRLTRKEWGSVDDDGDADELES
jgi:hypothetical protein